VRGVCRESRARWGSVHESERRLVQGAAAIRAGVFLDAAEIQSLAIDLPPITANPFGKREGAQRLPVEVDLVSLRDGEAVDVRSFEPVLAVSDGHSPFLFEPQAADGHELPRAAERGGDGIAWDLVRDGRRCRTSAVRGNAFLGCCSVIAFAAGQNQGDGYRG
jgi:hypothetical protein